MWGDPTRRAPSSRSNLESTVKLRVLGIRPSADAVAPPKIWLSLLYWFRWLVCACDHLVRLIERHRYSLCQGISTVASPGSAPREGATAKRSTVIAARNDGHHLKGAALRTDGTCPWNQYYPGEDAEGCPSAQGYTLQILSADCGSHCRSCAATGSYSNLRERLLLARMPLALYASVDTEGVLEREATFKPEKRREAEASPETWGMEGRGRLGAFAAKRRRRCCRRLGKTVES